MDTLYDRYIKRTRGRNQQTMASLWVKVYAEILDDFKYHQMKDNSKLLMYELFLLTRHEHGMDNTGKLPSKDEIAFLLRRSPDFIEDGIEQLSEIGIIAESDKGYTITKFEERQKADPPKERMRALRERKNDVTPALRERYEPVTIRNTEESRIDIDKIKDREKDKAVVVVNSINNAENQKPTTTTALDESVKDCFQNNFQLLTPLMLAELISAQSEYTAQWIIDAIMESVSSGVRKWSYAKKILERWKTQGRGKRKDKDMQDPQRFITGDYAGYVEH